jgi:LPXTG-motif cell wall-anchored protein
MSDGGAGAFVKLLEIPVVREITLCVTWFYSLKYAAHKGDWALFAVVGAIGLLIAGVFWFLYNRKRNKTGGGGKLLVVVVLMLLLLPLLVVAWRRRKGAARA